MSIVVKNAGDNSISPTNSPDDEAIRNLGNFNDPTPRTGMAAKQETNYNNDISHRQEQPNQVGNLFA